MFGKIIIKLVQPQCQITTRYLLLMLLRHCWCQHTHCKSTLI